MIAALWQTIFNPTEAEWLADQIQSVPLTIAEWSKQKKLIPANRREAALKCLYLNRTSFNGILHKAGPVGGWGQKLRTVGARFNRDKLSERVLELSEYSDRVTALNLGWRRLCNRFSNAPNAVFYLDPPYFYKAEQLYGHIFSSAEHTRFRNYLVKAEFPWLLSYDDAKEVRALYGNFGLKARVIDSTYSAHPLGGASFVGRELLYSNMPQLPLPCDEGVLEHVGLTVRRLSKTPVGKGGPLRKPISKIALALTPGRLHHANT
jgi:DNA adenine methylase